MPSSVAPSRIRRRYHYEPLGPNNDRDVARNWIACLLAAFVVVVMTTTILVFAPPAPDEELTTTVQPELGPLLSPARAAHGPTNQSGSPLHDPKSDDAFPDIRDEDVEVAYSRASQEEADHWRRWSDHDANDTRNASSLDDRFPRFYYADLGPHRSRTGVSEGHVLQRTASILKDQYRLPPHRAGARLRAHRIGENNRRCLDKRVPRHWRCDPGDRYRTHNGTCNNLKNPLWGAADTPYVRGLPAAYADGLSLPRVSALDGSALPSARNISVEIHASRELVKSPKYSALMTYWGQFVAHDVSKLEPNSRTLECCQLPDSSSTDHCLPIDISLTDPFYSRFNVTCIGMGRSAPVASPDCILGPREQVNLLTSYLDGSVVYGSNDEEMEQLRSFHDGELKTSCAVNNTMLPYITTRGQECTQDDTDNFCFISGDSRCNENVALVSLHTIFLREHNRLSALFRQMNPSWNDEKLYQETRRLVAAELQHITYGHYLPLLVGADVAARFGLGLSERGYYDGYSDSTDAAISNEFAAAAFRFGHSAVSDWFRFTDDAANWTVPLYRGLFGSSLVTRDPESLARLLYGTSVESAARIDAYIGDQIRNHVFQGRHLYGFDLNAISIQRGRDHGIPDYNSFRERCGMSRLQTFADLERVVDPPLARRYAQLYRSVDDLDLHSVGLAEHALPGGQLGPTFTCLIGDQFARLRQGDRFWYENGPRFSPYPFTEEQLTQIRKVTLARIICDNVPNIRSLPPNVYLQQSDWNRPVLCSGDRIPRLDISFWDSDKYRT